MTGRSRGFGWAVLGCAAAFLGCSSSESAPTRDAGLTQDTGGETDTGSGQGGDSGAGGCEDFSGAYALQGSCSVPGFTVFPSACIAQTGCRAQVAVEGTSAEATVTGNQLSVTFMLSGIPLQCVLTRSAGAPMALRCEAAGGAASCEAQVSAATFPGATRFCCNPAAQDCGDGQRCNIVGIGATNATGITACVAAGTAADGAMCTRAEGRLGADSCERGLSCVNYGQATASSRTCQPLCGSASDCMNGGRCIPIATVPRAGICRPTCTPFAADACAQGGCRYVNALAAGGDATSPLVRTAICTPAGSTAEGEACSSDNDCAPTLSCSRRSASDAFACRRICDSNNACPTGTTCSGTASASNPNAAGTCLP